MKNIVALKRENVLEYLDENIWKSDLFKDSFNSNEGLIYKVSKEFSSKPRFFYDATDFEIEKKNFTAWYNFIMKRDYNNVYLQDLYYLHEIVHTIITRYNLEDFSDYKFDEKHITPVMWQIRNEEDERYASLISECLIYDYIPGLRDKVFKSEKIWYDELPSLYRYSIQNNFNKMPIIPKLLDSLRFEAYLTPRTEIERTINKYSIQNGVWGKPWKNNNKYLVVERHLNKINYNKNMSEKELIEYQINWVKKNSENDVPFYNELKYFLDNVKL